MHTYIHLSKEDDLYNWKGGSCPLCLSIFQEVWLICNHNLTKKKNILIQGPSVNIQNISLLSSIINWHLYMNKHRYRHLDFLINSISSVFFGTIHQRPLRNLVIYTTLIQSTILAMLFTKFCREKMKRKHCSMFDLLP